MMLFFLFNDTATTEIYPLSLHDALPISRGARSDGRLVGRRVGARHAGGGRARRGGAAGGGRAARPLPRGVRAEPRPRPPDRESKRLEFRHAQISYGGFCL